MANTIELGKKDSMNVTGSYDVTVHTEQIYSAQVAWGAFKFEYVATGDRTWNAQNHSYDESSITGKFTGEDNQVTVTNHSNADLDVAFEYTSVVDGVEGKFSYKAKGDKNYNQTDKGITLGMAPYGQPNKASAITATLDLTGHFKGDTTELNKMGTIKVSIKANESTNTTKHDESGVHAESEIITPIIAE